MAEPEHPDLATTREMFAAWNDSDVDRMTDFWTEDGDWTWEDAPEIPDRRVVRGREAVEAHLRDLTSLIGGLHLEIESLTTVGDEVLAEAHFDVAGARSGVKFVDDSFHLIRFEDGRVRRYRMFTTREQALAAARTPR